MGMFNLGDLMLHNCFEMLPKVIAMTIKVVCLTYFFMLFYHIISINSPLCDNSNNKYSIVNTVLHQTTA